MNTHTTIAFLGTCYGAAAVLAYVIFRRYPDQSVTGMVQWVLFYLVTVIYPAYWTMTSLRALRRLGLEGNEELRRRAWAPVIVGGTSLLLGLGLLFRAVR